MPPPVKLTMNPLPKTGYYTMTRSFDNPKPDRRSNSWDKQETFKARRVYMSVHPDYDHNDRTKELLTTLADNGADEATITRERTKRGAPRFDVEMGVGYDVVRVITEADGTMLVPERNVVGRAFVEAWNDGVFVFDDSVAAFVKVVEKERYVTGGEIVEELHARGRVTREELDIIADLLRARQELRYAAEGAETAKKRKAAEQAGEAT